MSGLSCSACRTGDCLNLSSELLRSRSISRVHVLSYRPVTQSLPASFSIFSRGSVNLPTRSSQVSLALPSTVVSPAMTPQVLLDPESAALVRICCWMLAVKVGVHVVQRLLRVTEGGAVLYRALLLEGGRGRPAPAMAELRGQAGEGGADVGQGLPVAVELPGQALRLVDIHAFE